MGHGLPDFGATSAGATIFGLDDMGELAARLGSIVTFDRLGDVIFLDSFEDGLAGWQTAVYGTDGSVDLSMAAVRSGQFSARLVAPSDGGYHAELYKTIPLPVSSIFGVELSFSVDDETEKLLFAGFVWTGTLLLQFTVRYDPTSGEVSVRDAGGVYRVLLSGCWVLRSDYVLNTIKATFDMETGKYGRVLLNGKGASAAAYSASSAAAVVAPRLEVDISHYGNAGETPVMYVDDVILTQNEP